MSSLSIFGKRRILTAVSALAIAMGAGYLMQGVLATQTPLATVEDMPDAARILRSGRDPKPLPTPPAATLMPILLAPPVMPDRVQRPEAAPPQLWKDSQLSPFGFSCDPELSLKLRDAAMLDIRLFAPCDPETVVTLRQGALSIDLETDAFGRVETAMPALSTTSEILVDTGRRILRETMSVPEALEFSRVILTWEGPRILKMNAYEFGARRGESGHIWAGSSKTPSRALRGTGGFLVDLGDGAGRSAEVYTFPTGYSPLRGIVELIVEADVTEDTCGHMAKAIALQTGPLGGLSETDVRVTLPDCDRIGDVLELKNLLQDMRLAGR